jgi:hypothetical protein
MRANRGEQSVVIGGIILPIDYLREKKTTSCTTFIIICKWLLH